MSPGGTLCVCLYKGCLADAVRCLIESLGLTRRRQMDWNPCDTVMTDAVRCYSTHHKSKSHSRNATAALRSEVILNLLNVEEALNKHWNSCVEAVKQVVTAVASLGISLVA